jgi:hypothetical protein
MKSSPIDPAHKKFDGLKKALSKSKLPKTQLDDMFPHWTALCFGDYTKDIPLKTLLAALEINHSGLNAHAAQYLSQLLAALYQAKPLQKGSILSIIGDSELQKTEVKNRLKTLGLKYAANSDAATHILLGQRLNMEDLKWLDANVGRYTLMTEAMYFDFCKEQQGETDNREQLLQLLLHEDEVNVALGLELLKNNAAPQDFLTEIFFIFKFHKNKKLVLIAEKMLKIYGSAALKERLPYFKKEFFSDVFDSWMKNAKLNVGHFYQYAYLDSKKFSFFNRALPELSESELDDFFNKAILTWTAQEQSQYFNIPSGVDFERFAAKIYQCRSMTGLSINIQNHGPLKILPAGISALEKLEKLFIFPSLTEFPLELQQLPQLKFLHINVVSMSRLDGSFAKGFENLEYLKLHLCRFERLPKGIGNLKKLRFLDISGGDLQELSAELRQLECLEELNLENNQFKELPDVLFLMPQLRILKIRNRWSAAELRNLEALKLTLPDCEIFY